MQHEPRRIRLDRALTDDVGGRLIRIITSVVDHRLIRGLDDQVVPHGRYAKVFFHFAAWVALVPGGRDGLHNDVRINDFRRTVIQLNAAADQSVRLVDRGGVDPHRHPVRKRLAFRSGVSDRLV